MAYLLFFFWLIVLSWLLTRIRFVQNAALGSAVIVFLFFCKVAAGLAAGWLTHNDLQSDTWNYHQQALSEYQLLFSNPEAYFTNLFYTGYAHGYEGMLQTQNSYWNDLKDNLIIKLVSVMHVLSNGNYYVNVVLYNFIIFFGCIGLYRVFSQVYQSGKLLTAVLVFLLPSVLFYSSAIHKEGLIMALIGIIIFNTWQAFNKGFTAIRLIYILAATSFIFLFRNYVLFAMLPSFTAWLIAEKSKWTALKVFVAVYAVSALLFFTIQYIMPAVNLQQYMVKKQTAFFALEKGNTYIQTDTLQAHPASFIQSLPQAVQHSLLRPFISDMRLSKMLWPLSIELLFYEIIVIIYLLFRKRNTRVFSNPFVLFCLFFGLSVCLIIGFTVPVIGAIVRYRSIYLPLILAPFFLNMDWGKLIGYFKIKL